MDYFGSGDVVEVSSDFVISILIGVFGMLTLIIFIILIKWGLKK